MTDPQTAKNAITRAEQTRKTIEQAQAALTGKPHSADRELQLIELARQAGEADARLARLIEEAAQATDSAQHQNRE
ncbi:MAG TPA: hypothetical protein VGU24_07820 [Microvirga sp.]|jgi:hypothetical protein|nr:hypothetical protein [Microvirga sp.]